MPRYFGHVSDHYVLPRHVLARDDLRKEGGGEVAGDGRLNLKIVRVVLIAVRRAGSVVFAEYSATSNGAPSTVDAKCAIGQFLSGDTVTRVYVRSRRRAFSEFRVDDDRCVSKGFRYVGNFSHEGEGDVVA